MEKGLFRILNDWTRFRQSGAQSRPSSRRLLLESLEDRSLLSVVVPAATSSLSRPVRVVSTSGVISASKPVTTTPIHVAAPPQASGGICGRPLEEPESQKRYAFGN